MAQNNKSKSAEKKKDMNINFDIKSAIASAMDSFQFTGNKGKSNDSGKKRSTVSTPSKAPSQASRFEESRIGDVLDTSGMPKPKPPSVNYRAYGDMYGIVDSDKEGSKYESDAEREFDKRYVGTADVTIGGFVREHMKKPWVRLGIGVLVIIVITFVIYQLYINVYSDIKTETAIITTYSETIDVEGIAIRDEEIIDGNMSNSSVSAVKNGEKVLKGQPVINIFSSTKAAAAYERIEEIDKQILELESMVTASEDSANAVTNIEKLIDEQIIDLNEYTCENDLSKLGDIKNEISYLLNKRLVAMRKVENYQDRIDTLTSEKESLESTYSQKPSTINAPSSGYYVSSPDGYEDLLNTSMLEDLTADKLKGIMSQKVSVPENSMGKLLKDFTWYLACPVPAKEAEDYLAAGSVYTLILPYSETGSIQATLKYLNENDGKTSLAIFQCSSLLSELCDMRSQPVKIQVRSYKGFNIKKTALHVRVRNVEKTDEKGNVIGTYEERYPCVYALVGNQIYAKRINILYNGEKFVICKASNEDGSNYLSLYDEVITEGKGLYAGKIID